MMSFRDCCKSVMLVAVQNTDDSAAIAINLLHPTQLTRAWCRQFLFVSQTVVDSRGKLPICTSRSHVFCEMKTVQQTRCVNVNMVNVNGLLRFCLYRVEKLRETSCTVLL